MALDKKDLVTLVKLAAGAEKHSPVAYSFGDEKFSYDDLQNAAREELKKLSGTPKLFRENQNLIFSIMEEVVDEVLPKKILDQFGSFAEVKTFAQGDKPVFVQRITNASKRRARQFITKVGLAGVYEVFRLDGAEFEVQTSAFGGAAQCGYEEMLDGRITMADVLDIIVQGLDDAVYLEIERALRSSVSSLTASNKHSDTDFKEKEMDRLLSIADSYGPNSTIYCTFEFAATMIPQDNGWSDRMKDEFWSNGYFANYKNHRVIILQQSYEDDGTNTKKVLDPSYAWIIPGNEKPIKIAIEGETRVKQVENHDWSSEIRMYKKFGVAALVTNNICVYVNTSLTQEG